MAGKFRVAKPYLEVPNFPAVIIRLNENKHIYHICLLIQQIFINCIHQSSLWGYKRRKYTSCTASSCEAYCLTADIKQIITQLFTEI